MKKPHTKARGILFAAAGMFLIPGSVSEVSGPKGKTSSHLYRHRGLNRYWRNVTRQK